MDLEALKEAYAEKENIKHFDAWVGELFHWRSYKELREWYEGFAKFCYEYRRKPSR